MTRSVSKPLSRYGINIDPFAPSNGKPIYFATCALAERLELIQHLLQYSDQLLLILGEHGSGKTTLIAQLLAKVSDPWRIYHIEANPMLDLQLLLRRIASACGLPAEAQGRDGFEPYLEFLETHLDACEGSGVIPVLLVDDAHELPLEALMFLFSLAKTDREGTRFHIGLFCEPEITARLEILALSPMKQDIMHVLDIPRFTEEQTRDYLSQRLINSGVSEDITFSEAAVRSIHEASGGLPGRINMLARQALIEDEGVLEERVLEEKKRWQFIAAAALLAIFTLVLVVASLIEDETAPTLPAPAALPAPPHNSIEAPAGEMLAEIPLPPKSSGRQASEKGLGTGASLQSSGSPSPKPKAPDNRSAQAVSKPPAEKPGRSKAAADSKAEAPSEGQPSQGYMLQLLGTHTKETVNRFLAQHKLQGRASLYTTSRNGKPWYVVVYGPFPSRSKAMASIASLPPAVQALKPWPRAINGLKQVTTKRP